jgi:ribosomal protein L35AE/L33A
LIPPFFKLSLHFLRFAIAFLNYFLPRKYYHKDKTTLFTVNLLDVAAYLVSQTTNSTSNTYVKINNISETRTNKDNALNTANFLVFYSLAAWGRIYRGKTVVTSGKHFSYVT